MGRKQHYLIRTHVNLPSDMLEQVITVVGKEGVSKFSREAQLSRRDIADSRQPRSGSTHPTEMVRARGLVEGYNTR